MQSTTQNIADKSDSDMVGTYIASSSFETFYDQESKIWHGAVAEPLFGQGDSIGSVALKAMLKEPDHIVQICYQNGRQFTNREMARLSIQAAQHFGRLNLQQCDMIGLCAANSDYVAPIFFGAMFRGLCISSSDPSFNKNGLKHIYSMSTPKVMFCDGDIYHKVRQAFDECGLSSSTIYTVRNHIEGVPSILEFFEDTNVDEEFRVPPLKNGGDQVAMIICTSGSTGLPKGVCLSHIGLLHESINEAETSTRVLCFSSLYWGLGVLALIQSPVKCVTRIISENPFTPEDFFDIVKLYKVDVARMSPSHIPLCLVSSKLAESDLSSLRLWTTTGKNVPYSLIEKFRKFAPNCTFLSMYGMTEACAIVAVTEAEPTNSAGQLRANAEIKIVDDNGKHLGFTEMGEICIRTMFPWAGYLKNHAATKAIYDEDKWLHSGDMGYFNEDCRLYIVDRRKDIFKYNNFHFSPTNIEKVICEIPEVAEVCVVGIPDSTYDFLPAAAVVKRDSSFNLLESQVCQHVKNRMQDFENLHGGVYFFHSLPKTASGKTVRSEVTELCKNRRKSRKVVRIH